VRSIRAAGAYRRGADAGVRGGRTGRAYGAGVRGGRRGRTRPNSPPGPPRNADHAARGAPSRFIHALQVGQVLYDQFVLLHCDPGMAGA
jgi:hypothetical protein